MIFREVVERSRNRTIECIRRAIDERRSSVRVHVEPALRLKNGEIAHAPDGLKLPLRWDFYAEGDAGGKNADSLTVQFSEPVFVTWSNEMRVQVSDLCWDCMRFRLSPLPTDTDWSWLSKWFLQWFDPEDQNPKSETGLYNMVHFISDPQIDDGFVWFEVDFGSAPIKAFESLLYLIADHGYKTCNLGKGVITSA